MVAAIRGLVARRSMPIEKDMKIDRYELRVEIPGIEPGHVRVPARNDRLTIKAERPVNRGIRGRPT